MQFSPSVYEHAARLIDRSPWEVSRNLDLIIEGQVAAYGLYGHSPVVIGIDIYNLEAEGYGAVISQPAGNGIPAISAPPFSTTDEILSLPPLNPRTDGRIPLIVEAGKRVAQRCPAADVRIPLSGPFSIATNLMGIENLLCDITMNPDKVRQALFHLLEGQVKFCEEVAEKGLDIAFFESAAAPPLLSPELFREIELGPLQEIMQKTAAIVGHAVPCVIGGDTYPILEALLETGTGYLICPIETDQAKFMAKMKNHPEVMVRINMNHAIVSSGDLEAVYAEVDRVLELAASRGKVCIGTGALPYETDPQVVLESREYIRSIS